MDAQTLQRTMELIYSRCKRMLGDPEQAWDAVQEVFTRYYEVAGQQEIDQPLRFLYRLSTNHCIDLLRKRGRMFPLLEQTLEKQVGARTNRGEGRMIVKKLVTRFGQEAVEMLTYRHLDRMTYKEIAAIYNMSDRGVQKKLDRIEEMARKYLNR